MNDFSSLQALIVEDEGGVALLLEDMLEDLGCEVVGSVARLSAAFEAAQRATFNFAILDVNVAGEQSFPFARVLLDRGIPFVFSSGYGQEGLPSDLDRQRVLTKPFAMEDLRAAIISALSGGD